PGNVSHTDTAWVNVTDGSPTQIATFSIHPVPPDSIVQAMSFSFNHFFSDPNLAILFGLDVQNIVFPRMANPRVLDAGGNPISGLIYQLQSLDPTIATVGPSPINATNLQFAQQIFGLQPGQARILFQTTAYGVTLADTVAYTITWP